MTKRKPPGLSWGGWVDRQIRDAETQGGFDNLPGHGKPIEGLTDPHNDLTWIAAKLRRENLPIAAILPPSLALAKELEDLPAHLATMKSEAAVRQHVDDLNRRILEAHRRPQEGPPLLVMTRDVDAVFEAWRVSRAARLEAARVAREAAALAEAEAAAVESAHRERTGWRRWRRAGYRPAIARSSHSDSS